MQSKLEYSDLQSIGQVIGGTQSFLSSVFCLFFGAYVTKLIKKKVEKNLIDLKKRNTETDTEHLIRVYSELKLLKDSRKIEVQF